MGVYVDDKLFYVVNSASLDTTLPLAAGKYNTVIEEWDRCGGATYTPVNGISVLEGSSGHIPANAISSGDLVDRSWSWVHDKATPGSSVGYSLYPVSSPSIDKYARELSIPYSHYGGERYHLTFTHDASATHFAYDTYVYLADPSQVGNLEMDVNQVMANGRTVILGVQCSSSAGKWEYSEVIGSSPRWRLSTIACNPKAWSANAWHHIQIGSHRSSTGIATYDWVTLDGKTSYFQNATGPASLPLHWTPADILINFQLDGASSESGLMKVYIDKMIVYRW